MAASVWRPNTKGPRRKQGLEVQALRVKQGRVPAVTT